ncbi:MAG: MFS transporter [Planctomycetota bacterium]
MSDTPSVRSLTTVSDTTRRWLFATCFVALVATSFAFMIRLMLIDEWGTLYNLSATEKGQVLGAGIWPFAISIVLFSLFIDRVGYGKSLAFALVCHVVSVFVTISADGYWGLFWGNFIAAIAAGTVEAVINPVIATLYADRGKTKWLNILHAGWPGGLVIAGLLTLGMNDGGLFSSLFADGGAIDWRWTVGLLLIPTAAYGLMMLGARFPVNERVAAGVSYRAMLAEMGAGGALIAAGLIVWELFRVLADLNEIAASIWMTTALITIAAIVGGYYAYVRTVGRPLFIFLLLIMILLAITELGTDAWIKSLMEPVMRASFDLDGGWVLIYTATIMVLLRTFCGPVVKLLNPLGMLAVSALFAAAGLMLLSTAQGLLILGAATVYGIGQTFFWPTTLGFIAERFPRGGALTLNAIAGVGMLGVGIFGTPLLGSIQDDHAADTLRAAQPGIYAEVIGNTKVGVFGAYEPIDETKLAALPEPEQTQVAEVRDASKQEALFRVAALPLMMFVCYAGLWVYFRSRGGYTAVELSESNSKTHSTIDRFGVAR